MDEQAYSLEHHPRLKRVIGKSTPYARAGLINRVVNVEGLIARRSDLYLHLVLPLILVVDRPVEGLRAVQLATLLSTNSSFHNLVFGFLVESHGYTLDKVTLRAQPDQGTQYDPLIPHSISQSLTLLLDMPAITANAMIAKATTFRIGYRSQSL